VALLLSRTHYSLLTSPSSPQALCEEAVRLGLSHLVLNDTNGLYGLYPFAQAARRVGIRAVFGAEVVCQGRRLSLIAQDHRGYVSLCRLLSFFHGADARRAERVAAPTLDLSRACERFADGLWFVCGDPRLLPELSARVPRDRLLVGLPPRGPERVDPGAGKFSLAACRKLPDPGVAWPRRMLREVANDLDLRLCAVRDVWFATPRDYLLHQLFLAVKWNRPLRSLVGGGDPLHDLRGVGVAAADMHLPTSRQLREGHEDAPEAVAMAEEVLESCALDFSERAAPIFPPVELADGETAEGCLRDLVVRGVQRRYAGGDALDQARSRCDRELAEIERMGFAPYFMAVHQIVELARARDIPFVGRGSAAGSLVAHCLGLTDADPLRYGLLFERFLNPRRSDLPDIDLDFCWRRRDELVAAVYEHFGRDHVAMIATYNTCGPRAAYQEAAKVMGLPPQEAARRSKRLPWHGSRGLDLAETVDHTPGFFGAGRSAGGRGSISDSSTLPADAEGLLLDLAQQLLSAPRHLGVHPGGVVITPNPVDTYAPLERAAKGVVVTQYDMHFVEGLGMVKIDLLGNRALTIVDDCVTSLERLDVRVPDLRAIPEDDARTARLLQAGGTLGCFQVESPAMRTLLQQVGAKTMGRVIQAVALVRPGPASSGMKEAFIRRARGLEEAVAAHPLLLEVFADTFGIMLYQEDVIRAAMAVAGMDATDGDALRRDLGRRGRGDAARAAADDFVVAGLRRGLPRRAVEEVWDEMERFARYSFCKAHSVTYGRLAYRCVYLKARWPAAFLCAVLRNDAGYFAAGVYAEEAKRLGVELRAPCVQEGGAEHQLLGEGAIRVGLGAVHGMSARAVEKVMVARRAGGAFRDLNDLLHRVRPSRVEAEHLIQVGALDAFGVSRPELLWRLQVAMTSRAQRAVARSAVAARGALFVDALRPRDVSYPNLPEYNEQQRAEHELALLGFTLGRHPVDVLWRRGELPERARCVPCGKLGEHVDHVVRVCGFAVALRGHAIRRGVASSRRPDGKSGGMCFVTIEDGTGLVEATLFPKVYQRIGALLQGRGPFLFVGRVEERVGGGLGLRVQDLELP